ncbi:rod shape-determining protein MreC [Virgibacillus dakarensis]|uniref:Cell shape-determining protein MreC n=1 Tax=Lentibacillus populi TaxID=1827502 RepID=A0A9W5TUI9_9BACI|nr:MULTISPECIES: rod shape-determining protein MreC [Bacillaceae]MBT2215152.1 rod shape-determining protein MreC [Virgibacillus dakarensis]MTW84204.1 rod shape-determining protein MreC [Virgibacillus dakarensis]GGB28216.1 cell shape-determining protein MreC [Lentibacillus populi]
MQFRKKRLFIILIGFIILVALIGYSLRDRENLSTPEQFIKDSVGWVQSVIHAPVKFMTDIFTNIDDLKNTYEENQLLKEKLSEYKGLIYEVQEIKEENEELRKTLKKTESLRDFNPIQATVMSRTPERWVDQVTINKGMQAGVKQNMAVITGDGMIGKVQSVSQFSSTVQLLTGFDQFNRISATISRKDGKDIFGLIEEFDEESNSLLFKIIEESDKDLKKGELVVSSGMGGVFPEGLPIGTVKEVVPDQYGLTRTALIKPAANMYEINHVIVVDRDLTDSDEAKSDLEGKE